METNLALVLGKSALNLALIYRCLLSKWMGYGKLASVRSLYNILATGQYILC